MGEKERGLIKAILKTKARFEGNGLPILFLEDTVKGK